jgi:hypothetical protein
MQSSSSTLAASENRRARPPIDAVEHLAIVRARHAARLVRQERLDDRPLEIRKLVGAASSSLLLNFTVS